MHKLAESNGVHPAQLDGHGGHGVAPVLPPGIGAASVPSSSPAVPLPVPPLFRGKLLELATACDKARQDLDLYYQMLLLAMGLPPDTEWTVDTDTMVMTPVMPPHHKS